MDIAFNKNEDLNKQEVDKLKHKLEKVYLGGGEKKIACQRCKLHHNLHQIALGAGTK